MSPQPIQCKFFKDKRTRQASEISYLGCTLNIPHHLNWTFLPLIMAQRTEKPPAVTTAPKIRARAPKLLKLSRREVWTQAGRRTSPPGPR